ncbi:MAG: UDP-N-acetylmuramoyl-L-alanyl-D-glutamate--2,6-diaminopimelate ligase [Trueperaceae bacterium]|nr:MAG: UDP-N-acetylmuramoyl-L-alanyl-D-glutamate--2,6-diaminopimelate ligase [Trueperaceae bacterium]
MTLQHLIRQALGQELELPNVEVTGVTQDSRRVEPGNLFVARRGAVFDGHRYIEEATRRGAVAVVGERVDPDPDTPEGIPYVRVENDKTALAALAATFFEHPSKDLFVIGVTGTDGKTTTSFLLHHLLTGAHATGLLSTAGIRAGREDLEPEGHFTTPESSEVQRLLATFRDRGCTHAVIEASSHGFSLHRLDEIDFDIGVWTNISPEHLDFHGTFDDYLDAKRTLIYRSRASVLNADDGSFAKFRKATEDAITYGTQPVCDWRATDILEQPERLRFTLQRGSNEHNVDLPMVGIYNVHNALAALAAAHLAGLPIELLLDRLASFPGVPGRMQLLQSEPFSVIVDFAHTPTALTKALQTLRPHTEGRLILVIGAAGERDPGKRKPLGEVAAQYADLSIFTEEDSRSENTLAILATLAEGATETGAMENVSFKRIPDRRDAIRTAISEAQPGDVVLLAGKGHERTLERSSETLAWNEAAVAKRYL